MRFTILLRFFLEFFSVVVLLLIATAIFTIGQDLVFPLSVESNLITFIMLLLLVGAAFNSMFRLSGFINSTRDLCFGFTFILCAFFVVFFVPEFFLMLLKKV